MQINIGENGPYEVSGSVPLARRRIVVSELGEPIAMETTEDLPSEDTMWLCRCGQSANKPFCDGSHRRVGFDGTETAPRDGYAERARVMVGQGVVVRDDRGLCEHAGFCGNKLTNVWKMVGAEDSEATREAMTAMISRCPSGALSYREDADAADVEADLPQAIGLLANGPLAVTGGVTVVGADGVAYEVRNRMTLCRCGGSTNKPFCDGSHAKIGFSDAPGTL